LFNFATLALVWATEKPATAAKPLGHCASFADKVEKKKKNEEN
jgi:hypothetical protein